MRKTICLLCAVILCLALTGPAYAATNTFVPSITYKGGPTIEEAELNGEDITDCLVVTYLGMSQRGGTVSDAKKELQSVYEQLESGAMELPLDGDYVIRELIHVQFHPDTCVGAGHGHKEWLEEAGNCITIRFDVGIEANKDVKVLVCKDNQWNSAEKVTNNGDKTVTCALEDIGTLAFCVENEADVPKTGDAGFLLWVVILVVCAAAVVVLLLSKKKGKK